MPPIIPPFRGTISTTIESRGNLGDHITMGQLTTYVRHGRGPESREIWDPIGVDAVRMNFKG